MRGTYAAAAFAFAAFAIWGSLFPFELHPMPWSDTLTLFLGAWQTGPASWSRSDFVSNVLLFVPIGLFGAAALDWTWRRTRVLNAVVVIGGACLLSLGLELVQASILWRTASVVDVLAEALGALIGLAAWRGTSNHFDGAVASTRALIARASAVHRVLLAYAALFAIAWLVPFDFTLRPIEIADKFAHKRLLLPFTPSPDALSPSELLTIAIAAVPLGIAAVRLRRRTRHPIASAMLLVVPVMLVLELGQVSVFSRTTDGTALLAVWAGALSGAAAVRVTRSGTAAPLRSGTAG